MALCTLGLAVTLAIWYNIEVGYSVSLFKTRICKMCRRKRSKFIVAIILCLVVCIIVNIVCSRELLSVSRYEYSNSKITENIRIVQLTDLHNSQFGKNNNRLVKRVRKESPDVIFITGDMVNQDEERTEIIENLIRNLVKIAPVYYSLGNHEIGYGKNRSQRKALEGKIEQAGAVILEKEYIDVRINGQKLRIGGAYGYLMKKEEADIAKSRIPKKSGTSPWEKEAKDKTIQHFMEEFQDTDSFKVLLSHMPEGLLLWKGMEHWNVDLVFCGHVHGGQIRVPGIGGLYDPEEGFCPTYTKGMFECGNGTVIVSAGLGNSQKIPRINNLPEIVVCEIRPDM